MITRREEEQERLQEQLKLTTDQLCRLQDASPLDKFVAFALFIWTFVTPVGLENETSNLSLFQVPDDTPSFPEGMVQFPFSWLHQWSEHYWLVGDMLNC